MPAAWPIEKHEACALAYPVGTVIDRQFNVSTDSLAESLDICLIEEELAGALPVAALGSAVGQRQHVGSHVLDCGQDATVLVGSRRDRQWLTQRAAAK